MFLRGPTWESHGYSLGLMDLDIRLEKFPQWKFSDFLKISTDKPEKFPQWKFSDFLKITMLTRVEIFGFPENFHFCLA
jgi:hypothetical protein